MLSSVSFRPIFYSLFPLLISFSLPPFFLLPSLSLLSSIPPSSLPFVFIHSFPSLPLCLSSLSVSLSLCLCLPLSLSLSPSLSFSISLSVLS